MRKCLQQFIFNYLVNLYFVMFILFFIGETNILSK